MKQAAKVQKKTIEKPAVTKPALKWPLLYYLLTPFLLVAAALICYWPSRQYAFQFDDLANITKNYNVRLYTFKSLFYTSTRWISYWLNGIYYSIGKFDPSVYRLGNIFTHAILGLLVFFFLFLTLSHLKKRSFFSENAYFIALITAGLFLLHPVQTQTVSYIIQGQLEGIASFFIISMALCFWLSQHVNNALGKLLLYLLLFSFAFISPGTKEIAIVAPFLLLLVDWFLVAEGSWQELKSRWWIHAFVGLLVWGGYLVLLKPHYFGQLFGFSMEAKNNLGNIITANPSDMITPGAYFISEFKVILHYLGIFLWPFNISVEYDWVLSKSFFAVDCLLPFLALVMIGYLIIALLRRNKTNLAAFGLLWFFIYIAPRSTIIPSAELIVDYKTYGASVGWLFVIAACLVGVIYYATSWIKKYEFAKYSSFIVVPIGCILLCFCGYQTVVRNTIWRSGVDFWGSMLDTAPSKARIYNNYGVELSQNLKKYKEAVPYFQKAIALDKNYPDPHTNLSVSYAFLERVDDAIAELQESLRLNPYNPEAYNNIAAFFSQKKEYDKSEKALKSALALRPTYGKARLNYACLYKALGKNNEALEQMYLATTKCDLDNEYGFTMYGKLAMELKAFDKAIFAWSKAIECNPSNGENYFHLGNAYFMHNEFQTALGWYEKARTFMGDDPRIWFNTGECYGRMNNYSQALACYQKIQQYTPQMPQISLRIANCYACMGNFDVAERTVLGLLQLRLPDNVKVMADNALVQIQHHKPIALA